MPADAAPVVPHRLSTRSPAHAVLRKLRRYSAGVVFCAVAAAGLLAVQARSTSYQLPVALELLVALFLLLAVCIRLGLTRFRWYEVRADGLHYQGAFRQRHHVAWEDMCDLRYLAGVAVPFSVRVRGQRKPIRLGLPHPTLQDWTRNCVSRMQLDLESGGPLHTFRQPALFIGCACVLAISILATPLGILRALNGAPILATVLLAAVSISGAYVVLLHQPLTWDRTGVRVGRRRSAPVPWEAVQAEWRRTFLGGSALCLHRGGGSVVRVWLGEWGAPRFVARLAEAGIVPDHGAIGPAARTGLLFPAMLAIVTLLAGMHFHESARLIGELSSARLWALAGPTTFAQATDTRISYRGIEVRYTYEAYGKRYRGRGWLLPGAREELRARARFPVAYAPGAPGVAIPRGDPTIFYAGYFAIFGLFYLMLVLPLVALWDIVPAPTPFTVPNLAT